MKQEVITNSIYSGFTLEQPACPIPRRILAYLIDLGIISALIYAALVPGSILFITLKVVADSLKLSSTILNALIVLGAVVVVGAILCISSIYFIKAELKHGATFGKKLLGLSVISIDGKKLHFRQCLYRDLMRIVDASLILPGLLCMIINKQNRRLGDLAAGTIVIYSKRKAAEQDFFYIKQSEYELFYEKLSPAAPNEDIIKEYLTFALANFIHKNKDREKAYHWDPIVRQYFQTEFGKKIDRETTLLFFAEHCHQTKLKSYSHKTTIN
jgi:uncharacterized RDD family membrane protein YckC